VAHTVSTLGYRRLNEERVKNDTQRLVKQLEEEKAFNQAPETSVADMLIAADNDGKWVSINLAFERIMGYRAEEVLGKETPEQPLVLF